MNLNPIYLRKLFPSLIEIGLVVLGKKIFNFVNVFLFSSPLGKGQGWGPSFEQAWIPFIQGCCVPTLVKNGPEVLEKMICLFPQWNFAISFFSPFEKGQGPSFESPSPKDAVCQVKLKLAEWFRKKRFYLFRQCVFCYS